MNIIEIAKEYFPLVMAEFLIPFFALLMLGVFVRFITNLGTK